MRECRFVPCDFSETVGESWVEGLLCGQYEAAASFALKHLSEPRGKCLVIGSPLAEARSLRESGWGVTYLDIRKPDSIPAVVCDVRDMEFNGDFEAVSTSCVLCHVGTGRYGDALDEHGDETALLKIDRALKPGGVAALSFGPCIVGDVMTVYGVMHRAYTVKEIKRMMSLTSMQISSMEFWSATGREWIRDPVSTDPYESDYVSVFARKA